MKNGKEKAREPIRAAGGIVLRGAGRPEIAVVQLRKMSAWVLPKGKLAAGESALAAARREVLEETGHRVSVHEFLGTLAYETGGRAKVVQFWRMQTLGGPIGDLMRDVKAMEWLALDEAIARLSHAREQAFLEQVGPRAIQLAARRPRRSLARRPRQAPPPPPIAPALPELVAPVDFAAPLPADRLALARVASPALDSRAIERPVAEAIEATPIERTPLARPILEKRIFENGVFEKGIFEKNIFEKNIFEKTWDWLRQTTLLPKAERD